MKHLGLRMHRFSVDWSRVEPVEGKFDEEAIERYVSWCKMLTKEGIEPMITLHHFNEPVWFDERGGWEDASSVESFLRFVEFATSRLAPHCQHWCTLNELNGFAICGWLAGAHPPGKADQLPEMLRVMKNMMVAHGRASRAIRAASAGLNRTPVVCLAVSHVLFIPAWRLSPFTPIACVVALFLNYFFNFLWVDAIVRGRLNLVFELLVWLAGWTADLRALKGSVDVLGVNHYYRHTVSFGFDRSATGGGESSWESGAGAATDLNIKLPCRLVLTMAGDSRFEKSDMGWDLTPSSMERLLRTLWARYKVPIIVTESGIADGEEPDERRSRYLAACLGVAHRLRTKEGVDLRGYLFWTLLDNFEWAEGFRPRFGLLRTDFETLKRHGRPSNEILRALTLGGQKKKKK
jgi:beta-glucosidase